MPSLEVLAAAKPNGQILDWDSFLIAKEITPAQELPSTQRHLYRVHAPADLSSHLVLRLAKTLAQFHNSSFFHGDLKSRHILVTQAADRNADFVLVDLEKCRHLPRLPLVVKDLLAARDLIQLLSSLEVGTDPEGYREVLLSEYLRNLQNSGRRSNLRQTLLALYGPAGPFSQGKTVFQNVCDLLRRRK